MCVHLALTDIPDNVNSPFPPQLAQALAPDRVRELSVSHYLTVGSPLLSRLPGLVFPLVKSSGFFGGGRGRSGRGGRRWFFFLILFTSKLKRE